MTTSNPAENRAAPGWPQSIGVMLLESVTRFGPNTAIRQKVKGQYQPITYTELLAEAAGAAGGLSELSLKRGDRLAIVSENRPEWLWVEMACQFLGIVTVPLYPTLPPNQIAYSLKDAGCRAVVVSDRSQLAKIHHVWSELPALEVTVVMDGVDEATTDGGRVVGLQQLRTAGSPLNPAELEAAARQSGPDDLASIVYTSGTTGDPKGAMLTHGNFVSNAAAVAQMIHIDQSDEFLSFLPLNHVFERIAGYYFPLLCGAKVAYAESVLRVRNNLPEVKPTIMVGVPRLFDGLREGVLSTVSKAPPTRQKLFHIAMAIGRDRARAMEGGGAASRVTSMLYAAADLFVLSKVREKMGCERLKYFVSGSAPLNQETAWFLLALGIRILEGYGLTETSPVISVNRPDNWKVGSIGLPIPHVEVKIAEDGEICARGPNIMKGYLNKPEATAEVIDAEGWFHTGDIGRIDDDGFIYITDRKKDLLVLGTGKKVAPQPIENRLKNSPYIKEAVVLGDRMSAVVALIVPQFDLMESFGKEKGWTFDGNAALCALPEAKKLIRSEIDRLTTDLAEFERVRQFALLEHEFSVESGELTPTLKVKRKVVTTNHAELIRTLGG